MKLDDLDAKIYLNFYLRQLRKRNGSKVVIEILQIILDESQPTSAVAKKIPRLQHSESPMSDSESIEAMYLLGLCYWYGLGVSRDYKEAAKLFAQAAAKDHAPAQTKLAFCYEQGLGIDQNIKQAIEFLERAVKQGDADAQYNIGMWYDKGVYGFESNQKRAFEFWKMSANQGHPAACFKIGIYYLFGWNGVQINEAEALRLIKLSAAQEFPRALLELGRCFQYGSYVEQDDEMAAGFYSLAIEQCGSQCYVAAYNHLAYLYRYGRGVTKDKKQAVKLYEIVLAKVASGAKVIDDQDDQRVAETQFNLAELLENDPDATVNTKMRAFELIELSASTGYSNAKYSLGLFYLFDSRARDLKRAALLFRLRHNIIRYIVSRDFFERYFSNEQDFPVLDNAVAHYHKHKENDITALTTLGFCYHMGLGTEQDLPKAAELYREAIRKGVSCYWDLFTCYRSQYQAGNLNVRVLTGFYDFLEKQMNNPAERKTADEDSRTTCALLLSYLYENGAPGLDKDYDKAFRYYKIAKKVSMVISDKDTDSKMSCFYNPLFNHRKEMQTIFSDFIKDKNTVSIIADYIFETEQPSTGSRCVVS